MYINLNVLSTLYNIFIIFTFVIIMIIVKIWNSMYLKAYKVILLKISSFNFIFRWWKLLFCTYKRLRIYRINVRTRFILIFNFTLINWGWLWTLKLNWNIWLDFCNQIFITNTLIFKQSLQPKSQLNAPNKPSTQNPQPNP